jgi:uroporphyrinogen-III synthase
LTVGDARRRGTLALITRPGEAGQRLTSALRERGQRALWWPAFDLLAPAHLEPLQALLQRLAEFDLVVFVSPAAVRSLATLGLCGVWPAATRIGAVGSSTLQLARNLLPGAAAARSLRPGAEGSPCEAPGAPAPGAKEGGAKAGSEALWEALQKEPDRPRNVLIVRADSGREWLGDRLQQAGSRVEYASVYRRAVHTPSQEQRAALGACWGVGDRAVAVLTSSEAVATLDRQLAEAPDIKSWLRRGRALCSHERIAQALLAAGYGEVRECEPTPQGVLEAIDGAGRSEPAPALAEARSR